MRNVFLLILMSVGVAVTAAEEKKEVIIISPRYEVTTAMRDPFLKHDVVEIKDEEVAEEVTEEVVVKIFGAMKGAQGQVIGVFNFGVLTVGKSKKVSVKGREVEVLLQSLNIKTMEGDLMVGEEILHITKIGGEK